MLIKSKILKNNFLTRILVKSSNLKPFKNSFINFNAFHFLNDDNISSYEWRNGFALAFLAHLNISIYNCIEIF